MRKFLVSEELIGRILIYLETRPYKDVVHIMQDIMNKDHVIAEKPIDNPENTALNESLTQ